MVAQELIADDAHFIEARATINGAVILWQEGNLCLDSTFCTDHRVHFAGSALRAIARSTGVIAASLTAGAATAGLIHQPFLLVELLFSCGKHKIISAVTAFESFVNEVQLGTSL